MAYRFHRGKKIGFVQTHCETKKRTLFVVANKRVAMVDEPIGDSEKLEQSPNLHPFFFKLISEDLTEF